MGNLDFIIEAAPATYETPPQNDNGFIVEEEVQFVEVLPLVDPSDVYNRNIFNRWSATFIALGYLSLGYSSAFTYLSSEAAYENWASYLLVPAGVGVVSSLASSWLAIINLRRASKYNDRINASYDPNRY